MTDTRLSPGDPAPDFTLTADTGADVTLSSTARAEGDRLLLPGRDDPGLHQAGLRLHRLAGLACRAPATTVLGISPDQPEKLAKFRERDAPHDHAAVRPVDRETLAAYGAFGEKSLYGKVVQGVIRSTFVIDEDGDVELAQYNVKATGHVAKLRKDLGLASTD